jgi:two-component system response regulator RegA
MEHQVHSNRAIPAGAGQIDIPVERSLLIVDDDRPFLARLAKAMETRGYTVITASSVGDGMNAISRFAPDYAVIDVRLADGNGLDVVSELKRSHPATRSLVLTGYGNIASAVTAIKLGAFDYLAKPADADEIDAALRGATAAKAPIPETLMSADRVRWEHIQRIFELCDRNVSETARRLNMHRRTLQRILAKRAPK